MVHIVAEHAQLSEKADQLQNQYQDAKSNLDKELSRTSDLETQVGFILEILAENLLSCLLPEKSSVCWFNLKMSIIEHLTRFADLLQTRDQHR